MITFYHASGSPFARRVWLALEHKELPYEEKLLSFAAGDLKQPEYLAINPRHKVPAIVDDGFALCESVAIVEYLDQRYPDSGRPLFPRDVKAAAITRRFVQEFDHYYAAAHGRLLRQTLFRPTPDGDAGEIAEARKALTAELDAYERALSGDFFVGDLSAADFALYPLLALTLRVGKRAPQHGIDDAVGPKLSAWMKRIEALPYFAKTIPSNWK